MNPLLQPKLPQHRGIRHAVSLIVVLMLFVLSSCGDKCIDSGRSKKNRPSMEEVQPGELFKLRYRLKWLHQAQFAGAYMAKEKGFYQAWGLDVEFLPGGGDHPPYQSLMEGSADIASFNLVTALKYHNPKNPAVLMAQISQKNSTVLVGKKSSGIKTIQDLDGKKIGVWREEGGDHTLFFLESLGLNIRAIPMDWSVNLLLENAVDMINAMYYNEYHRLLMTGLDEEDLVVFDLADYGFDLVDDGIYTTRDFFEKHPRQCRDFTAATLEGWNYAFQNPEETLAVVLRYLRENHQPANLEHQAWMLEHIKSRILENPARVGYLDPKDFDLANRILIERGIIDKPVDYQTFYPHEHK